MRPKFLFLVLALCLGSITSNAQTISASRQENIDALVGQFISSSKVPGIAVSVSIKGELAFSKGYGWADIEQQVPVNPSESKFRIASISKTLSADALMQLVESEKLNLDKPVQTYVPGFPQKRWPITTRMAAGHLAGIRHYRGDEFLSTKHYRSVIDGLAIFKDDDLIHEPTTKYSYSSYGFNLISAVIEGASGTEFLEYMQVNVFDKLAMKNTTPDFLDRIITNRGGYYQRRDEGVENAPAVDNSYKWAGGGFLSTSEDLVLFARAHMSTEYISESAMRTLTTSQKTRDGKKTNYGIGWRTAIDTEGYHWLGHSGGAVGGTSRFMIYPDEEIIVVVLTNLSSARLGNLPEQIAWIAMKE
jgi:serine beta-lactamase-like protein LACTB